MARHFSMKDSPSSCLLKFVLCFAVLLARISNSATGQRLLGCPISRLQIVSFNETLLPRTVNNVVPQIQFSFGPLVGTSFLNYGPNHTDVWCAPEVETVPQPFVNIIFTEPVAILGIISGGYTYQTSDILNGMREYVSSFTLQHAPSSNGNFTLYHADLTGNGETEFIIDDSRVDQLVILREPFSAHRIRLQVLERTRTPLINITCWSMAFLGCAAAEAMYEEPAQVTEPAPTTCSTNTSPLIETVVITTTVMATPPSDCSMAVAGQSGQQAVSVAIPVALVTIVTVVIVVVLGVLVCVKKGRHKLTSDVGASSAPPANVHYINTNTRGGSFAESGNCRNSRERAITIKEVENELYSLNESKIDDSVVYEAIPSSGTNNAAIYGTQLDIVSPGHVGVGMAAAQEPDPPPYSLLTVELDSPMETTPQHHVPDAQNYSTVDSDIYAEPDSPTEGSTTATMRREGDFQLSRNESYGSLPSVQTPRYATPTSSLRYIPELCANGRAEGGEEEYEPIAVLPHGRATWREH